MKRIFLSLLSGSLFKLLLLENSFALYASEGSFSTDNSFKSSQYLIGYTPFFLPYKQNGTERNLSIVFRAAVHFWRINNKNLNLKYLNRHRSKPQFT